MEPALKTIYKTKAVPGLNEKFAYKNVHCVPTLEKVVLNVGFGKAEDRKAAAEAVIGDLGKITGQRAVPTKAKNAISNFKLRIGDTVGARVTLRGARMWEFLDRFINVASPTIRDFRGLSSKSFDGNGNYTCGISDHTIFPEIELDKVTRTIGFDLTIVTSAQTDNEARELLTLIGMPFRKPGSAA
ncbi:MAG: 50S ribosomal protein L5 [Verrucomicrobiales bacterium]|jgi:large subunit ribosomal protein L5|nr:50S ribosomal protein L5 [Verrucomicrobiales bacterium]MBP9222709.1 50S ribosomal protein L5 [Verrucomicrobiales bacterium]HQZ29091.1 50S ribosomal protein L5 [Verrucomicrobiales bacterium]